MRVRSPALLVYAGILLLITLSIAASYFSLAHADNWSFTAPICYAKDDEERKKYQAIPPRLIIAWYCDRPGGIQGYVRVYSFADVIAALKKDIPFGLSKDQKSLLDQTITTRDLTPDEFKDASAFVLLARPVATVAPSGLAKSRTVYLALADRTRGADAKKTVAVGSPCLINDRLVVWNAAKTIATATDYYAVAGGFAQCKLVGAVSK